MLRSYFYLVRLGARMMVAIHLGVLPWQGVSMYRIEHGLCTVFPIAARQVKFIFKDIGNMATAI